MFLIFLFIHEIKSLFSSAACNGLAWPPHALTRVCMSFRRSGIFLIEDSGSPGTAIALTRGGHERIVAFDSFNATEMLEK